MSNPTLGLVLEGSREPVGPDRMAARAMAVDLTAGVVPGVSALARRYDALILDLWGVLHDGVRPYPWVIPCLEKLRAAGKRTCALSNAPRRVDRIAAYLAEIGLPPELLGAIYSSGEATYEALRENRGDPPLGGGRCFFIGAAADAALASVDGVRLVRNPAEADFVLCTGIEAVDDRLENYQGILRACLRHALPLICANPDLEVMHGDRIKMCAGTLAAFYEGEGGRVVYYGKPFRQVYERCLEILAAPRERVLAVGDSFLTDVSGADVAGLDCLFIAAGIEAGDMLAPDGSVDGAALARRAAAWKRRPRWTAPRFAW